MKEWPRRGEKIEAPADPGAVARRLPFGWRLYVFGDIHGRVDLLSGTMNRVAADLNARPCPSPLCVFLGDYVDRGPASRSVLDYLMALELEWPIVCLMGNHEAYALQFLRDPAFLPVWHGVGGRETLRSYGLDNPPTSGARISSLLSSRFGDALGPHRNFLEALPVSFTLGDYFFCHAGVRPNRPLAFQTPEDLLEIREPFLSHPGEFGRLVVHGHTAAPTPVVRSNRIGIDTMAYATSNLTCLVIEEESAHFLKASAA